MVVDTTPTNDAQPPPRLQQKLNNKMNKVANIKGL